jgi:tryptophan-rich sensory protein
VHASTVRRDLPAWESILAAAIFAVATLAVVLLGTVATSSGRDWYDTLDKPSFTPPNATFGIVWTVLYVLIAVAGWLAWRATASPAPTVWWGVQMALNLLWTAVFFGLESPLAGVVVIAALIAAVAADLQVSSRVSTTAGVLLFPYLIWCGFAAALNIGVLVLN